MVRGVNGDATARYCAMDSERTQRARFGTESQRLRDLSHAAALPGQLPDLAADRVGAAFAMAAELLLCVARGGGRGDDHGATPRTGFRLADLCGIRGGGADGAAQY